MTQIDSVVGQDVNHTKPLSPSEMMRARHPNLFSDSLVISAVRLARSVFEYHLDTLTSRKQEYEFEHFCRKLAEKELCPNLRPQTGPTGGGDSKVDTETYPVADEISERWWIGDARAGSERWAFAFSAKKKWLPKIRSDVANILSTGRDYKRIYFFTNQFVSDRARAKLEDEYKNSSIPVHIVDRSWIVEKVYENDHLNMAISTLGIDYALEEKPKRLGARDVARLAELEELDKQIIDSSRYQGAKYQLVEDCLSAAILARGLERSRHEVEGRFSQAQNLARELSIPQQLMRVAYNRAWTAYWWYEDYVAFNKFYADVEKHLINSSEANDLDKLYNLWTLLKPAEMLGFIQSDIAQSDIRRATLMRLLEATANDLARPNNSLQAKTSIAFLDAVDAQWANDQSRLNQVWLDLIQIIELSVGMGQYPIERVAKMIGEIGNCIESETFDALYAKVVDAMRSRRSDGDAGIAFRDRGIQKLERDKPYEAIQWIGRAEELLIKEEYQKELVMTLIVGSFAYQQAGLLWAARNKLLVVVDRCFYSLATTGEMWTGTLSILQRLVWIELQLGRIPQVLQAMSWGSFVMRQSNLSDEAKAIYEQEVQEQEAVLAIHLLRVPYEALSSVEQLPDVLERIGLTNARLALLYVLGHEKRIYAERYFPSTTTKEEMNAFFERWLDQPATKDLPPYLTLVERGKTRLRSVILGSEFMILTPNNCTSLSLAESLLGALEAFLATSNESDLAPHAEQTIIVIKVLDTVDGVLTFNFVNRIDADAEITHPAKIEFKDSSEIINFSEWLRDTVVKIAAHRFIIRDPEAWLKRIAGEERALSRAIALGDMVTIGQNVFGNEPRVRLSDWIEPDDVHYECLRSEPWHTFITPKFQAEATTFGAKPIPPKLLDRAHIKHTDRQVMSPIDIPRWDAAKWQGTLFAVFDQQPPILALLFENGQVGCEIFDAWKCKWGEEDQHDVLRIVIVTGISKREPTHYAVAVGPNLNQQVRGDAKTFLFVSRVNRMTPTTSKNLDFFLAQYQRYGSYLLASATMGVQPKIAMASIMKKRHLHIRQAWEIGENDPDMMVLAADDDPIIPPTIADAPVTKTLERIRAMRR